MADVSGRAAGASPGRIDRGQLLLVVALGMAVMFVALALVLNTAIYTENIATRGSDLGGGREVVGYRYAAAEGVAGTIEYANAHNDSSDAALRSNLSAGVTDWADLGAKHGAADATVVDVALVDQTNGTRIEQDTTRNFTNATGAADWTLVDGVSGTRGFVIHVNDTDTLDDIDGNPFQVLVIDENFNTWSVAIGEDGGNVVVEVSDAGGTTLCSPASAPVWVNLTAGTVGGEGCDALSFGNGVSTPYEIQYWNAQNVTGRYDLVVDNDSLSDDPTADYDTSGGSPHVRHAIYDATVRLTVESSRLRYATNVTAMPGESDG